MKNLEELKKTIKERQKKLEDAGKYLKTQFIGIDGCIDKFINSVKIWYVMPELQTRPLIVNIFGITGVGKTDLVRKFVNYIDFTDRFCEIQMDSKEGNATIEDYLENTLDHNESGVLLLDEIQRFRSVSEDGKEGNSTKYQDLWMLLSDGVLQSNSKIRQELLQLIVEDEYWEERQSPAADVQDDEEDEEDSLTKSMKGDKKAPKKKKDFKYKMYYYEAARLKKFLKLKESVHSIMEYSKEKKIELVKSKINSKEIYEGKKYNKLLIIISGNLDEAFLVAGNVDDADRDADVYHEYSKTIDIVAIKRALANRFKPEQIARFGNIHIIYPILNKESNQKVIRRKIDDISENIKKQHGIDMKFDQSVCDVVYSNGVFPVQGLRPLLSTISAIVENSIPVFLFEYLNKELSGNIIVSHKDGKLFSVIKGKKVSYEIPRVLDEIRKKTTDNKLALVSVHEAGHSVAYAVLRKVSPTQMVATTSSSESGGFIGTHKTLGSKKDCLDDVIIDFAGRAAEELIFGKDLITSGAISDYISATRCIATMYRNTGMGDYFGIYATRAANKEMLDSTAEIEEKIEQKAKELYAQAIEILAENMEFLMAVSEELFKNKKIEQEDFVKIAEPFVGKIGIINSGTEVESDFHKILSKAIKTNKRKEIALLK